MLNNDNSDIITMIMTTTTTKTITVKRKDFLGNDEIRMVTFHFDIKF